MSEPIKKLSTVPFDADQQKPQRRVVDAGTYAVDPQGHLVVIRTGQKLKAGWRYATDADMSEKAEAEAQRRAAAAGEPAESGEDEDDDQGDGDADAGETEQGA